MRSTRPIASRLALVCLLAAGGCAVHDSRIANYGRTRLLGMKEVDLEACLGSPDQHSTFPGTDILTYTVTSTASTSFTLPVVGGISTSNGAYCHATFRLDDGAVTHVIYSGEKNATLAPDAYCAPIMRSCLAELDQLKHETGLVRSGSPPGAGQAAASQR